jgi:hypothetical protein
MKLRERSNISMDMGHDERKAATLEEETYSK